MSGDDDSDRRSERDPADVDPDRAAILARRRRFIAIALSGLTTAACDEPASKPDACLKVKVSDPKEPKGTPPQPCLKVDVATSGDGADDGGKGETAGDGNAGDESTSAAPTPCLEVMPTPCLSPPPHPCLMVAPPRPCLDVPAPTPRPSPCLKVAPPPDPKPRPCLKVRRPDPEPEDVE